MEDIGGGENVGGCPQRWVGLGGRAFEGGRDPGEWKMYQLWSVNMVAR